MRLEDISAVLFDLDGTVYYGNKIIPGANDTIKFFRENGKQIFFTTNNSTRTRKQIFEKLRNMGIDCQIEEILCSSYLASQYIKKLEINDFFVLGSEGLIAELKEAGINVCNEENAKNLLIGYNPILSYEQLSIAVRVAIKAKYIFTCNKERTFPGENAVILPGCGAMTAAVEWCSKRECDLVIGKPSTYMVEWIADKHNINKKNILVIGDTLESDVKMANLAGCKSIYITDKYLEEENTALSIKDVVDCFI